MFSERVMGFKNNVLTIRWFIVSLFLWPAFLDQHLVKAQSDPKQTTERYDTCNGGEHTVIDDFRRQIEYMTPDQGAHLCDAYLETGWYRFLVNGTDATLPTSCVEPNSCGTQAPVWLDLTDGPPEVGEEKIARACSSWATTGQETNCCFFPYRVIMRNCGDFFIYRLGSTQACNIAFCVEAQQIECEEGQLYDTIQKQCIAVTTPILSTPRVCQDGEQFNEELGQCIATDVEIERPFITTYVDETGAYVNCSWKPLAPLRDVNYVVTWYDANVFGDLQPILLGPALQLGTDVFPGTTVMCGVKSGTDILGPNDDTEVLSDPYFLGLKVRESNVKIREDGRSVNLTVYSTIPLFCGKDAPDTECVLGVSLVAFGADGELNERLRFSTCYIEFSAADCLGPVCSEHVITVTLYPNVEYSSSAPNEVVTLIGAIDDFGRGLWRQEIVDVQLELEELPLAQCHVFSDPHVITFDGKIYDMYSRGTFVLHKSLSRDFTMHIRVSDCGNNEGYCACGFVARDTGDVVSIDTCSRQQPPGTADVTFPGNFISDDVKVYESKGGRLLTVVFASGTLIKTYLEPWGMSISLLTPPTDLGFSRGLCGFYDSDMDNDFHDAQGKVMAKSASDRLTALEFVQIWRLPPASSFFDQPPINDAQPLGVTSRCDCSATNTGGVCPLTSLVNDITPTVQASEDKTNFFFSESGLVGSLDDIPATVTSGDEFGDYDDNGIPYFAEINFLEIEPSRRRRQANSRRETFPDATLDFVRPRNGSAAYFFQPDYLLASTAFIPNWPAASGLTENEATDACAERLFGSNVALNCAEFLGSSLGTAFEFCKADLQVKGNTSWADFTVPLLESLCDLGLLQSARDFREPGAIRAAWPKILEDAIACPKGCKNGECGPEGCVCEPGFTGPECEKTVDLDSENVTTVSDPFIPISSTTSDITPEPSTTTISTTSTTTTAAPTTTTTTTTTTTATTTTTRTTTPTTTTTTTPTTTSTASTTTTTPTTTTIPTTTTASTTTTTTPTTTTTTPTTTTTTPTPTTTNTPTTPNTMSTPAMTTTATFVAPLLTTPRETIGSIEAGRGDEDILQAQTFRFVLCDINQERCTDVSFDVTSQQGPFRCRVMAVEVGEGEVAPLSSNKPISTGSTFSSDGQFVCLLPYLDYLRQIFNTRRPFDSVRVEVVTDYAGNSQELTETVVSTTIFTIYDSLCRSCGVDGRFGCTTKPDSCYIEGKCYTRYQPQPYDSCLQCRPELTKEKWSTRANNIAPVISFEERPLVFVGQDIRFRIRVNDPDGSRLILSLDRKDAFISQSGLFQWRAITNDVEEGVVKTEQFILFARDDCNATASIKIEVVTVPCDCENGGTCVNPRANGDQYQYDCICPSGYSGSRCQQEVNECADSPCVNGACVDLINTFQCVCDPGFEGELCDAASDQCRNEPCYPGVLCQPTAAGSFVCGPCPLGFTGDGASCVDIDSCQSSPCSAGVACRDLAPPSDGFECGACPLFFDGNGQRCVRLGDSACSTGVCSGKVTCVELTTYPGYKCGPCPPGYNGSGIKCTPICERPCPPGKVCVEPGQCGCPSGYKGEHCNIAICLPVCRNGGVCIAPDQCRCFSGYTGAQCQETSCSPPCANDGRCIGRNRCLCRYGFTGARCHLQACQTPCQNGGECVGPNRCSCQAGYQGRFCEQATCYPPCLNGGTCVQPGRCACASGYEGVHCERALCYPPCQHGGLCKRFNTCKCQQGYVGHRCQTAVCRPQCLNGGRCVAPNTCSCPSGWSRHRCDQPLCHLPCRNGGVCFKPDICVCRRGYGGSDCTAPICWPACENDGWCLAPNVCYCRYGFYGPRCKKRKPGRREFL